MTVYSLKPEHIAGYYPFLRDYIINAHRRSPSDIDPVQVFQDGIDGKVTFWLVLDGKSPNGLIVTRIEAWPKGAMCRVIAAGGREMKSWLQSAIGTIREHAKANDCLGLVAEGRRGWGKVLGTAPARYVYEMELSE